MKKTVITLGLCFLMASNCYAADRSIKMSTNPVKPEPGKTVNFQCTGTGEWRAPLVSAQIKIYNRTTAEGALPLVTQAMTINNLTASYNYTIPAGERIGTWNYTCEIKDRRNSVRRTASFTVIQPVVQPPPVEPPPPPPPPPPPVEPPVDPPVTGPIAAHNTITAYDGPSTCITCHRTEATEMLQSLHVKWAGPTPELTNTDGAELGKAKGGINTFCTYAMSSKSACFTCHVRTDGNAPDLAKAEDVDCLMCHNDVYQRKFVTDPNNIQEVTNILGEIKTYVFGKEDAQGNYITAPDFEKMPAGTNMVNIARTVHLPTTKSCLRCHATAGGGDWTKRGDMGINSATATVDQDVHLAKDGANLSCVSCHAALNHKISGRGIDLRSTEAADPTCQSCHNAAPHSDATLNRHAQGQVSCQVCHIREFAKGGATEMSRDWRKPVWSATFCQGQGGFIGEEDRQASVKPEYVWFDGTSFVYNVGETISQDERGVYAMAKANGGPFNGKSRIVPIKRHSSFMPLHESGKIIPPAIMWMFMTGDFDLAVKEGMKEQGMSGSYSLVETDAEMLISHGVEPKAKAPTCVQCHNGSGSTPDGTGMLPLGKLGYHTVPTQVKSCTLCHSAKTSSNWESMHSTHRSKVSCASCHTNAPTGLVRPQSSLCSSCHDSKSWSNSRHSTHISKNIACTSCHTFSNL